MKNINTYNEYIAEKYGKNILIALASLFTIGINKSQAQDIEKDQVKLSIVNSIINFNKSSDKNITKLDLPKEVKNPDDFIHNYLEIQPDHTIVVKPKFISDDLKLNINAPLYSNNKLYPKLDQVGVTYTIKF